MSTRTEPNRWQRVAQRFAASRVGSWIFSHTLHHVDRLLLRASGSRISIPEVLAGLPVIELTTTGARTGQERTVPVVGLRDGEDWILIASNWGGDRHPAWYHNLSANPTVEVTHDDRTAPYVAREATGDERAGYWECATDRYVGFESYRRRSGDRRIPVVVLSPADDERSSDR